MTPYLTIDEAQDYFDTRLHTEVWDSATTIDQTKALISATRIINNLKFKGFKTDSEQINEFPRFKQLTVPYDIKIAACEIALQLLDDVDMEAEIEALRSGSYNYSTLRTQTDEKIYPAHINAGVPSAIAWRYLEPYLADPLSIKIS